MYRRIGIPTISLVSVILLALPFTAQAAEPLNDSSKNLTSLSVKKIPVEVPKDFSSLPLPLAQVNDAPSGLDSGLAEAKKLLGARFNVASWNDSRTQLTIHVNAPLKAETKTKVLNFLAAVSAKIVIDSYSRADLEKAAWELATSGQPVSGRKVISAGPNADSSGLDVTVDAAPMERRPLAAPEKLRGFPVKVQVGEAPVPTSRAYDPVAPHWGGATMSRPADQAGRIYVCTTGFGVGVQEGSAIRTSLITADHCGAVGSQWRTGKFSDSPVLGTMQNTSAAGTDTRRIEGAQFGPVIYNGPNNSNTGTAIKGAVTSILNDVYCYSGAPSGMVCNNRVTSLNQTICYALFQCYRNMVYTNQTTDTPALGNGDSGGPVIASRNGGDAYAVGIISGMLSPTTRCTGDPGSDAEGGRKCSTQGIMAPVEGFFQDNPNYGILVAG